MATCLRTYLYGEMGGGGGGGGGGSSLRLAKYEFSSIVHVRLNCMVLFSHNTIQFWTAGPLLYPGARGR